MLKAFPLRSGFCITAACPGLICWAKDALADRAKNTVTAIPKNCLRFIFKLSSRWEWRWRIMIRGPICSAAKFLPFFPHVTLSQLVWRSCELMLESCRAEIALTYSIDCLKAIICLKLREEKRRHEARVFRIETHTLLNAPRLFGDSLLDDAIFPPKLALGV